VSPALAADSKDVSAGMQLFLLERSAASAEKKVAFRRRNRLISPRMADRYYDADMFGV
jgi:hypothetical protein